MIAQLAGPILIIVLYGAGFGSGWLWSEVRRSKSRRFHDYGNTAAFHNKEGSK